MTIRIDKEMIGLLIMIWVAFGHSFWLMAIRHNGYQVVQQKHINEGIFMVLMMILCWVLGPLGYVIYFFFNPVNRNDA